MDNCNHVWVPVGWVQDERGYNVIDECDLCDAERTGPPVPFATVEAVQADLGRAE